MPQDTVAGLKALAGQQGITKSDLAGMSPKMMLGTARELRQRKADRASALQAAGQQELAEERTEIQRRGQETAERRTELKEQAQQTDRMYKAMQTALEKKKMKVEKKRNDILNTLTQKRGELTDKKIEQLEQEMEFADRKMELIDAHKDDNNKVQTNMGPRTLGEIMLANRAGIDMKPVERNIVKTFKNPDGTYSSLTTVPGQAEPEVIHHKDLEAGATLTPDKTVEKELGPGEKTERREEAKARVEASRSEDFTQSVINSWEENNPEEARYLAFPGQDNQTKIAEAQQSLTDRFKNSLRGSFPDEDISVRVGDNGPGFYGSKSGFIRPLPPNVEAQNVIETEEQSTSGYNSPGEVKQAYANGDISKDEAKSILRNNWPDKFK